MPATWGDAREWGTGLDGLPLVGTVGGFSQANDAVNAQLTRLVVTSEVALSVVLLVGRGLMVRSLQNLLRIELGFVPQRVLTLSLDFAQEKYPTPARDRAFHRTLLERLAALPDVEAAGAVHNRPLEYGPIGSDNWVIPEGQPLDSRSVSANSLSVKENVSGQTESINPTSMRSARRVATMVFASYLPW